MCSSDLTITIGPRHKSALVHFRIYLLLHHFGVHVGDEADGELADDLAGDNGLCSRSGESSLDTMKRQTRIPPAVHQDFLLRDKWYT